MISKQEFKQKFYQEFKRERAMFEAASKKSVIYLTVTSLIIVILTVVAGIVIANRTGNEGNWLFVGGAGLLALLLLAVFPSMSIKDKQMRRFKDFSFERVLKLISNNDKLNYNRSGVMPESLFKESRFFQGNYTTYEGCDYVTFPIERTGTKEPIAILSGSDIKVKHVTTSDGETHEKQVFKGVLFAVQFEHEFKCILELNSTKKRELGTLELESSEFNKIFKSQTSNQIYARMILTVNLMQRLIDLQQLAKCKIAFAFRGKNLFIYLRKNLFKMQLNKPKFDFKLIEPIYDDLFLIEQIVNEIQSNTKVFGK